MKNKKIIKIKVIKRESEKFFYFKEEKLYFTCLLASFEFDEGTLTIIRNNKEFVKCDICIYGTQAETMCFVGEDLFKLINKRAFNCLYAKDLEIGDIIQLNFFAEKNFNLNRELQWYGTKFKEK